MVKPAYESGNQAMESCWFLMTHRSAAGPSGNEQSAGDPRLTSAPGGLPPMPISLVCVVHQHLSACSALCKISPVPSV